MLTYPKINPVALQLGSLKIYWYGLLYLLGVLFCYGLLLRQIKYSSWLTKTKIDDLIFYCAMGIILGGRIGFVLFYFPADIWRNPLSLITFWEPGRSFHGGLLGVIIAIAIFAKKYYVSFLRVADKVALVTPIGLACGRLGNFINGELYGRVTTVPWGMVFPHIDNQVRHPSQIYQLLLEGILLFILLNVYAQRKLNPGALSGAFLILYSIFRGGVEFLREPDVSHGFVYANLTMGQLLSIPMFMLGVYLFLRARRNATIS